MVSQCHFLVNISFPSESKLDSIMVSQITWGSLVDFSASLVFSWLQEMTRSVVKQINKFFMIKSLNRLIKVNIVKKSDLSERIIREEKRAIFLFPESL